MLIRNRFILLHIGFDTINLLPFGFALCLFPKLGNPGCRLTGLLLIEFSCSWLPVIERMGCGPVYPGEHCAYKWTGMYLSPVRWHWPHHFHVEVM